MKTTLVRALVVVLALSGAAATAHSKTTGKVAVTAPAGVPVPLCPPNDPDGCGID